MAKESMKAREVKRAKLVAKYAEKRAALEANCQNRMILLKLLKLHRNYRSCLRILIRFVCTIAVRLTGRPKGYIRQFGISQNPVP